MSTTAESTQESLEANAPAPGAIYRGLLFVDPFAGLSIEGRPSMWASIRNGQLWRVSDDPKDALYRSER